MPDDQKCIMSAVCTNYNNVDDVWRFQLKELSIKGVDIKCKSDKCRLLAFDAVNNPFDKFERQGPAKKPRKAAAPKQPQNGESRRKSTKN